MARPVRDLVGQVFGRLTVLGRVGNDGDGRARFACRCVCGGQLVVASRSLVRGDTTSCGCRRDEVSAATGRRVARHGRARTASYKRWENMKARCFNVNHPKYPDYGGRGITMDAAWAADFVVFAPAVEAEIGPCPPRQSIDRINNDGNYEPGNIRWATQTVQLKNRRPAGKAKHR